MFLLLCALLPAAVAAFQHPFTAPHPGEITVSPQLAAHHPLHHSRPAAVHATFSSDAPVSLRLRTKAQTVHRPRIQPLSEEWERRRRLPAEWREQDASSPWDPVTVEAPDVTDVETLLNLGKMASNAYTEHKNGSQHSDWTDLGGNWNWVRSLDSFRLCGELFVNKPYCALLTFTAFSTVQLLWLGTRRHSRPCLCDSGQLDGNNSHKGN
jgi:hypothetical protein